MENAQQETTHKSKPHRGTSVSHEGTLSPPARLEESQNKYSTPLLHAGAEENVEKYLTPLLHSRPEESVHKYSTPLLHAEHMKIWTNIKLHY